MKDKKLQKTALITGTTSKLGQIISLFLASKGINIIIHYNTNEKKAVDLQNKIKKTGAVCHLIKADLTKISAIPKLIDSIMQNHNKVDFLINNAADFYPTKFYESTEKDWDHFMNINLKVPYFLCQNISKLMPFDESSTIINIADIYGFRPIIDYLPYCISKAGVISLTKGLAKELTPIRVNAVAPGAIEFSHHQTENNRKKIIKNTLLKRTGTPEEIAETIYFLITNKYITGQIINVDGGKTLLYSG